jgi:DNA primase
VEDRNYSAFLAEVRASTDLVPLVSEYVSLRKAGRRFKGLCPFHDEKTPSFSVDPDRNLFYCFGCSTGGDAFKFLMLREGMDFPEAARALGERVGIRPPERQGPRADRRRRLLDANARALAFFRSRLAGEGGRVAREYLEGRGVHADAVEAFEIGYAPDSWDALRDHLSRAGVPRGAAVEAGLLIDKNGDGQRVYDRFRNRVIFPIRSLGGEVVAFGGRTLSPEEPAKYLNSPESPVYTKGETLYGLAAARQSIREKDYAILVEGYLDLVGIAAAGYPNVVATLGTALTATQARLLRRYTEKIVVCYDPDEAGNKATLRALEIFLGMGLRATVLRLPEGLDPDDFVRERGPEAFGEALRGSTPAIAFLAEHFAEEVDLSDPHERAEGVNRVLPFVARLKSPIERTGHLQTIASAFRVDGDLVLAELRNTLKAGSRSLRPAAARPDRGADPRAPLTVTPAERRLLGILFADAETRAAVLEHLHPDDLSGSPIEPILRVLIEHAQTDPGAEDAAALMAVIPDEAGRNVVARALVEQEDEESTVDDARSCLRAIRKARLSVERRDLQKELERTADPSALDELLSRKIELSRKIDAL